MGEVGDGGRYAWVHELVGDGPEAWSVKQEIIARDQHIMYLGDQLREARQSEVTDSRCLAQALLPNGQWKRCHRDTDHVTTEPHVWLESLDRVGGRPLLATWYATRTSTPTISHVLVKGHDR